MSGINTVIFYSSDIFVFAGVDQALLSSTLVFGLNVIMTVVSAYLIDRIGRKILLVRGSAVMTLSLFGLGIVLKFFPVRFACCRYVFTCGALHTLFVSF